MFKNHYKGIFKYIFALLFDIFAFYVLLLKPFEKQVTLESCLLKSPQMNILYIVGMNNELPKSNQISNPPPILPSILRLYEFLQPTLQSTIWVTYLSFAPIFLNYSLHPKKYLTVSKYVIFSLTWF